MISPLLSSHSYAEMIRNNQDRQSAIQLFEIGAAALAKQTSISQTICLYAKKIADQPQLGSPHWFKADALADRSKSRHPKTILSELSSHNNGEVSK